MKKKLQNGDLDFLLAADSIFIHFLFCASYRVIFPSWFERKTEVETSNISFYLRQWGWFVMPIPSRISNKHNLPAPAVLFGSGLVLTIEKIWLGNDSTMLVWVHCLPCSLILLWMIQQDWYMTNIFHISLIIYSNDDTSKLFEFLDTDQKDLYTLKFSSLTAQDTFHLTLWYPSSWRRRCF